MTAGAHYCDETELAAIITIPIAAASLAAYLEATLTMIDNRINHRCWLTSNATGSDGDALNSVEYEAFLKVMQNTRLSREGVPSEVKFQDSFFSAESKFLMNDIRIKSKRTAWWTTPQ